MNCLKCSSSRYVKSGFVNAKARKKCKDCGCNFTQSHKHGKPNSIKRQALQLYLEGLGFRSIGRYLGVSYVSVLRWIRSFGEQALQCRRVSGKIKVAELDQMHSYLGSKKTSAGYGLLLIDWENAISIVLSANVIEKQVTRFGKSLNLN